MSKCVTLPEAAPAPAPSEEKELPPFKDIRPLDIPPQRSSSPTGVEGAVEAWAAQPVADRDDLDAAVQVLRELVALFGRLIADKEADGDLTGVGYLRDQQRRFLQEERGLRVEHTAQIRRVLTTYRDELGKLTGSGPAR